MSQLVKVQDSRREFIDALCEIAEKDERVCLIVPDVGFLYIEKFKDKFPGRFFNTGVTEEATMLMAAGMALSGMRPFVFSMIPFVAFRPFEMVRNGIALHNAPVILIGVKGSEKYKFLGFSHNMIFDDEDIYHLKPYLSCYTPTIENVKDVVKEAYSSNKPAYIRL